jgi:DNA transformation protein
MAVNPSYREFVLDQLGRVALGIRGRGMFGGLGIWADDLFFALIGDGTLFLKVDDSTRDDFVAVGMGPFMPFGDGGEVMQYYELPADVLEEPERLKPWVEKAIGVARRARLAKRPAPKKKPAAKKKPPVKKRKR